MPRLDDLVKLGVARAGAALSITDPSGRLRYANGAFTELFGWSADDDVHIGVITPEEDRGWLATYMSRLVGGDDDEYRTVKRFVRRDGTEFNGTVVVRPVQVDGQCVGLVGHVAPVERRELVDDPRVGKLLEHNASTITLVDDAGGLIETAGRYRATLGYPPEFWDTRSIFDIIVPSDAVRVLEMREQIVERPHEPITTDVRVIDADGDEQVLEATAVNLLDDPDVRGIVITSRNVTEERTARAELASLRDQAVAEAERRSALIATVSHELRNPLHALAGLSELLASDAGLGESQRSIAATLHRQVTQMARVTDDLLDHSRLELGTIQPQVGPTRMRDLVDDVIELARAGVGDRPVSVTADVDAAVPAIVTTDGSRIHQLVRNLVENAVKFTERGRVDVSVSCTEHIAERCVLRISVRDTGPGIATDDLDRVFEPFHTTAPTTGHSGAGIGLSVTRRILDMLDGTIELTSEVGRGSTFEVEIPVGAIAAEPISDPPGQAAEAADERPIVLVVEDNEVNQELARHQLDRLGMAPVIVGSAERAFEIVRDRRLDAILMDHQLPGMNGREATRELRRLGVDTPIVGVTASATAADERACLDAGMDAFLPKPVGLEQLRVVLGQLVSSDRAGTANTRGQAPEATAEPEVAVVDTRTLDELAGELGDPAIVISLVTTFLGELDQRRRDIVSADSDTAARQAHSLKSGARMLGAFPLAAACAGLETGDVDAQAVVEHADASETAFRNWLAQQPERGPT